MNILFICDEYPPGKNGGIGTMVQVLSRELVKQGHKVFVAGLYAYSYGGKSFEEDQGVKIWRFRYGINLYLPGDHIIHKIFNRIPGSIKKHLNGKKAFTRFTNFLTELIQKEKIEIIEVPDWNTFSMRIGYLVDWPVFKIPLVLKSHGSYTYFADEMNIQPKKNLLAIDENLFKRADAHTAVSYYTANKNKQLFNISENIKVLYNSIHLPKLQNLPRAEQKVVFSGTLIEKKGIFQLMKAWNLVNLEKQKATLVIFGKGNITYLKTLLSPSAQDTVVFKGHVTREELFNELSTATLAVFPSYSETFGLAPLEAMSLGCPVIFTKRASGPEVVKNGVDGELVEPDNVAEISDSILRIMKDQKLQKYYSEEALKTVDYKFNVIHSAQEHITYYTDVIKNFKVE